MGCTQSQPLIAEEPPAEDPELPGLLVSDDVFLEKSSGLTGGSSVSHHVVTEKKNGNRSLGRYLPTSLRGYVGNKHPTTTTTSTEITTTSHRTTSSAALLMLASQQLRPFCNIFANHISFTKTPSLPSFEKSPVEREFLEQTLLSHCLFENLKPQDLLRLISAFEPVTICLTHATTDEEATLIRQGDVVDQNSAYFYILHKGKCSVSVDGVIQTFVSSGGSFGELALLYDCPRSATVQAIFDDYVDPTETVGTEQSSTTFDPLFEGHRGLVRLFRVDQLSFRKISHDSDQANTSFKMELLNSVSFLEGISEHSKEKLAEAMTARPFHKKEYLIKRGSTNCSWFLIASGVVIAKNISYGANHRWNGERLSLTQSGMYRDTEMSKCESFGHRSLLTDELPVADCVAKSDGLAYTIDQETFRDVIGNITTALKRGNDQMKLKSIPVLAETTQLDSQMLSFLSSQITEEDLEAGTVICEEGKPLERQPALYFVRSGRVQIHSSRRPTPEDVLEEGYLGDDQLYADTNTKSAFVASYSATVVEDCKCGVLTLSKCRRIIDTHMMGKPQNVREYDSLFVPVTKTITLENVILHRIIGAGTFGQVWLVSRVTAAQTRRTYALKIQSMYELTTSGQAGLILREKNIMSQFHSPFISKLLSSFKDDRYVYMVLPLLQGGELYRRIRSSPGGRMPEQDAKFYFACVSQGLSYMHRLGFVYRDLKPENVMLDDAGYAVLVDLGFCKKITKKTYTLCGTPLYLAPEMILSQGYAYGADHWSLGILLYEMLLGRTPFYEPGMGKSELFRAILKHKVRVPRDLSIVVLNLIAGLLKREPTKRIGNLAGGEDDIIDHPWLDGMDYDALFSRNVTPPHIPDVQDALDDKHYENWDHIKDFRLREFPELTEEQKNLFVSF